MTKTSHARSKPNKRGRRKQTEERVLLLEGRITAVEQVLASHLRAGLSGRAIATHRSAPAAADPAIKSTLLRMTRKQHCAYQLLMEGASNAEIARRMGVTESTAKTYVRAIMRKFGVDTRSKLLVLTLDTWTALDPAEYEEFTKLPKDWHARQDIDAFAEPSARPDPAAS
jgi:DNA-binding CsgD family transcriptional regulator